MSYVKVYNKAAKREYVMPRKTANNLPENGNYEIREECDAFGRVNNFNNFLITKKDEHREPIKLGNSTGGEKIAVSTGDEQPDSKKSKKESGQSTTKGTVARLKPGSSRKKDSGTVDKDDDDDE